MKSPTIKEYLAPWDRLREMAALAATARRQYADLIERAATDIRRRNNWNHPRRWRSMIRFKNWNGNILF